MASNLNKCTYCGKTFAKERTLQVHLCEPKRRHLQRDEKWVVNAFYGVPEILPDTSAQFKT